MEEPSLEHPIPGLKAADGLKADGLVEAEWGGIAGVDAQGDGAGAALAEEGQAGYQERAAQAATAGVWVNSEVGDPGTWVAVGVLVGCVEHGVARRQDARG